MIRIAMAFSVSLVLAPSAGAEHVKPNDAPPHVDSAIIEKNWPSISNRSTLIAPGLRPVRVALPATINRDDPDASVTGYTDVPGEDYLQRLRWTETDEGGIIARIEFHSIGAKGLRLELLGFFADLHLELRVYDPDGHAVFGPFTAPRLNDDFTWWTPTIFGDDIGLEYHIGPGDPLPEFMPEISRILYNYRDGFGDPILGGPLPCHLDVSCYPTWQTEADAVVKISYTQACTGNGKVCSAALMNRVPADGLPILLTAHHCVRTQSEVNSLQVFWFDQTDGCNGNPPDPNNLPRSMGGLLLKATQHWDSTIIGLREPPPTASYLGWDATEWIEPEPATGIHHPAGSWKRITFGAYFLPDENQGVDDDCDPDVTVDMWIVVIPEGNGVIEGGSSGSPIFDDRRRVRGPLTGGPPANCDADNAKEYGRLDRAFNQGGLQYYFRNIPTVVHVDGGVPGDPGNRGTTERGTSANPFNTVEEATFCVIEGDDIAIEPGSYNEQLRIYRPMRLTRNGSSGEVTIGR